MNKAKDIPFFFDKIILIESLNGVHKRTAQDLYRNILQLEFAGKNPIYESIETKDDLITLLKSIEQQVSQNKIHPLIHIEAHGLDSEIGLSLNNGESISWEELKPYFRSINISCCNNLILCISACNASNIVKELVTAFYDNDQCEVPFFGFVGPTGRIAMEDLYNQYSIFYKNLSKLKNFDLAVKEMNKTTTCQFSHYSCYQAFLIIVNKFADTFIKNRVVNIQNDPNVLYEYCELYFYTYNQQCDVNAILKILSDEQFYIDYLNKRMEDYLIIKNCNGDHNRFPKIRNLENFKKTVPEKVLIKKHLT